MSELDGSNHKIIIHSSREGIHSITVDPLGGYSFNFYHFCIVDQIATYVW